MSESSMEDDVDGVVIERLTEDEEWCCGIVVFVAKVAVPGEKTS